jgi:CDP-diacylglycerol---glycerol-3-phosphate 3-phosphatidyltransferase
VTGSIVSQGLRARVRGLATPIATGLGRIGLTPNQLTVIGFAISVVAAVAAARGSWVLAGVLLVVGGVFDLFDGALARATGRVSRLGAFLDSVFDRAGEAVVYVGIVIVGIVTRSQLIVLLASTAMAGAFLVSYVRAKAESLGYTPGSRMAAIGLAPREVRIVILVAGLVLTGIEGTAQPLLVLQAMELPFGLLVELPHAGEVWLVGALLLITILATITAIQRIVHVIRQESNKEHA